MTEEFLDLVALATLAISGVGFFVGFLWAIPAAYRDRHQVDSEERGMAIFASYQLLVAVLTTLSLLGLAATALLILFFDMDATPGVLGTRRLLIFAATCAITALVVGGPVARKRANRGEATRVREKERERQERAQLQETAEETRDSVREIQLAAVEVQKKLETETAAIRERLEQQDAQRQSERDQVKDDLGAEQSKIRDALGEQQDTVRDRLEEHDTRSDVRQDKSDAVADEERIAARMHRLEETQARQERKQDADLHISENIENKLDAVAEEQRVVGEDLVAEQSKVRGALGKEQDTVREKKEKREREQDSRRED